MVQKHRPDCRLVQFFGPGLENLEEPQRWGPIRARSGFKSFKRNFYVVFASFFVFLNIVNPFNLSTFTNKKNISRSLFMVKCFTSDTFNASEFILCNKNKNTPNLRTFMHNKSSNFLLFQQFHDTKKSTKFQILH